MPSLKDRGKEIANTLGLDWSLFERLIQQESGWQQFEPGGRILTSPSGALGVSQLMPATAAGLKVNPYDSTQNITGGAKYLKQMLDYFHGDVVRGVAAYNAGPGFVETWNGTRQELHDILGKNGSHPYRQTEDYLDAILGKNWTTGGIDGGGTTGPPGIVDGITKGILDGIGGGLSSGISGGFTTLISNKELMYNAGGWIAGSSLIIFGMLAAASSNSKKVAVAYVDTGSKIVGSATGLRR